MLYFKYIGSASGWKSKGRGDIRKFKIQYLSLEVPNSIIVVRIITVRSSAIVRLEPPVEHWGWLVAFFRISANFNIFGNLWVIGYDMGYGIFWELMTFWANYDLWIFLQFRTFLAIFEMFERFDVLEDWSPKASKNHTWDGLTDRKIQFWSDSCANDNRLLARKSEFKKTCTSHIFIQWKPKAGK